MPHDYAAQRADTYAVWADIDDSADLPDVAGIDYAFVPHDSADWDAAETALGEAGFECARVEDDEGPRVATALAKAPPSNRITAFLMADSVIAAKAEQKTPEVYYNTARMPKRIRADNGAILLRGACMGIRGMAGACRSTKDDLTAATEAAGKVLVF